jgi:hypothetical protein
VIGDSYCVIVRELVGSIYVCIYSFFITLLFSYVLLVSPVILVVIVLPSLLPFPPYGCSVAIHLCLFVLEVVSFVIVHVGLSVYSLDLWFRTVVVIAVFICMTLTLCLFFLRRISAFALDFCAIVCSAGELRSFHCCREEVFLCSDFSISVVIGAIPSTPELISAYWLKILSLISLVHGHKLYSTFPFEDIVLKAV